MKSSPIFKNLISNSAKDWQLNKQVIFIIIVLPFFIAFLGISTGLISKDLFKWFTGEDRFGETIQVVFYSIALILSIGMLNRLLKQKMKGVAILYIGLCLGLFFLIGEELSWGQRIFGWITPEELMNINKQNETNLHNIYGVGSTFKWLQLLVGMYGTVLPLFFIRLSSSNKYQNSISFITPHYIIIPYFAFIFVWRIFRNFFEAPKSYYFAISEYNEVMEIILSLGFVFFMIYQLRRSRIRQSKRQNFSV